MNTFLEKLENTLSPIGTKLGNQRHLKAISSGMMFALPFIVIGSFFLILAHPPINMELYNEQTANFFMKFLASWRGFADEYYAQITLPYNLTMGLFSLYTVFGISYQLSSEYKLNPAMNGFISLVTFLLVSTTISDGGLSTEYLGTNGVFTSIVVALLSVEISKLFKKPQFQIKLHETVPTAITVFLNSLLPLLVNMVLFYGTSLILLGAFGQTFPQLVMNVLTPATGIANNLWGYIAIVTFGNILWLFGINGPSIIFPIIFTLGIANTGQNSELVALGLEPTNPMNLQMFRIAIMGGSGGALGLLVLMVKSKAKHLRTLGKLSIVPVISGINEPLIFGVPLVLNPILAIPFIITPIINLILTYYAQVLDFISMGFIVDPSFTPFFAQAYLSSLDWRNVVFTFILIAMNTVIYYPFFKIYEKRFV
ncbi:PTS sugar transporter subunit IIC [Lacticigenium naphthae]|uniref:PTS sugar transporter subunit IIC n=1 Tax=Lacticigenium naphthae TaxID=515351 RepID=UPI000426433B|nr:PTS transporter subunit EIIC [Lacticigenium naphthae]